MRILEWISVAFLGGFLVAGMVAPLSAAQRWRVVGLGAAEILVGMALSRAWGLGRELARAWAKPPASAWAPWWAVASCGT